MSSRVTFTTICLNKMKPAFVHTGRRFGLLLAGPRCARHTARSTNQQVKARTEYQTIVHVNDPVPSQEPKHLQSISGDQHNVTETTERTSDDNMRTKKRMMLCLAIPAEPPARHPRCLQVIWTRYCLGWCLTLFIRQQGSGPNSSRRGF